MWISFKSNPVSCSGSGSASLLGIDSIPGALISHIVLLCAMLSVNAHKHLVYIAIYPGMSSPSSPMFHPLSLWPYPIQAQDAIIHDPASSIAGHAMRRLVSPMPLLGKHHLVHCHMWSY